MEWVCHVWSENYANNIGLKFSQDIAVLRYDKYVEFLLRKSTQVEQIAQLSQFFQVEQFQLDVHNRHCRLFQIIESMEPKFNVLNLTVQKLQSTVRKVLEDRLMLESLGDLHVDMCSESINNTEFKVRWHLFAKDV